MCLGCTNNFVNDVLSNPRAKIPVKCCFCNKEIEAEKFETYLNSEQGVIYFDHLIKEWARENGKISMVCTYCSYWEIWNSPHELFYCKNKDWGKTTCCGCRKEIKVW
jgi:hypothetical protein